MADLDLTVGTGLLRTEDHRYYWNDEGPFPGVTTVQGVLDKSEPLIRWAKREVAACAIRNIDWLSREVAEGRAEEAHKYMVAMPDRIRDAAADLGTSVHYFAEQEALGIGVAVPTDVWPFLRQYMAWRDEWQPEYLAIEYQGINLRHRYGGTGDLIVKVKGETWLLDIKSGRYYDETALQLVACAEFEFIGKPNDATQYAMPEVDRFGILDLKTDGWQVVEYRFDRAATFAAFAALAEVYHWKQGHKRVRQPAWTGRAKEEAA